VDYLVIGWRPAVNSTAEAIFVALITIEITTAKTAASGRRYVRATEAACAAQGVTAWHRILPTTVTATEAVSGFAILLPVAVGCTGNTVLTVTRLTDPISANSRARDFTTNTIGGASITVFAKFADTVSAITGTRIPDLVTSFPGTGGCPALAAQN
jgi:hypothetical protein